MIAYKCKNCGGQMDFGGSGGFVCPYCGSKSFFTDADFKGNKQFRKMLLQFQKAKAEKKDFDYSADLLWQPAGTDCFPMSNGQTLQIEYMRKSDLGGCTCYLARESVVYVFKTDHEGALFLAGVGKLVFPAADDRLHRSFPELKMDLPLKSGGRMIAFLRRPNCYPAVIFAPWGSEHLAWVISRMENMCCALEYAGIEHGDISPESVWVNPFSHEGILYGDWRGVRAKRTAGDLAALRKTAIRLAENTRKPIQMYRFLNAAPGRDAFADFEKWDKVIMDGFGGHRFVKMNL